MRKPGRRTQHPVPRNDAMELADAAAYVEALYAHILHRTPGQVEHDHWVGNLLAGMPAQEVFRHFTTCEEYTHRTQVAEAFPPGHFHSPIVDPSTVGGYVQRHRAAMSAAPIAGIDTAGAKMLAFWQQHAAFIARTPFRSERFSRLRYFYNNPVFSYGDAIMLRAMIGALRPRRIIEIGSGFSSACTLDTLDEIGLAACEVTCIDPDPVRLRDLLRPDDDRRIAIIAEQVQSIPLDIFADLQSSDILFIDSTHVLKTGSDVHYELFEILPALRSGVAVHIHDIHYPFEYPDAWIFESNLSWNEIYAVRAFLMYNTAFSITFWNGWFAAAFADEIRAVIPAFLLNPGGSLWLRRT